jgi:hypothetical protein
MMTNGISVVIHTIPLISLVTLDLLFFTLLGCRQQRKQPFACRDRSNKHYRVSIAVTFKVETEALTPVAMWGEVGVGWVWVG